MKIKSVESHFAMAYKILGSIHELTVSGQVSLTNVGEWEYEWQLLECCIQAIKKLKVVRRRKADKSNTRCWTVKTACCVLTIDSVTIQGTITLSRSGPALDHYHWRWTPTPKS
jgi:hypothetical protein